MNYTFSQETSEKLVLLGVKPVYRIGWAPNVYVDALHLLIPENAKKVWGEGEGEPCDDCYYKLNDECPICFPWVAKTHQLLTLIQQGTPIEDIEEWLNEKR